MANELSFNSKKFFQNRKSIREVKREPTTKNTILTKRKPIFFSSTVLLLLYRPRAKGKNKQKLIFFLTYSISDYK